MRTLARGLRARADVLLEIERGALPKIASLPAAERLAARTEALLGVMREVAAEAARVARAVRAAHAAKRRP